MTGYTLPAEILAREYMTTDNECEAGVILRELDAQRTDY